MDARSNPPKGESRRDAMTDLSLPPSVTVSPTIVGVSVLTDDGVTVDAAFVE